MLGMALWNEARPAPSLPDAVLALVPRLDLVARYNYHLWLLAYVPPALWLYRRDRAQFLNFLWWGGWLSLLRGLCICATGLGPVDGADINAGLDAATRWHAWVAIVNPFSALTTDAPHVYLTKDLFFSGHTASTFLLYLCCRGQRTLGAVALAAHVLTVAVVFMAHLHYTIDVIGAWAVTFALFTFCRRRGAGPVLASAPCGPSSV